MKQISRKVKCFWARYWKLRKTIFVNKKFLQYNLIKEYKKVVEFRNMLRIRRTLPSFKANFLKFLKIVLLVLWTSQKPNILISQFIYVQLSSPGIFPFSNIVIRFSVRFPCCVTNFHDSKNILNESDIG